MKNEVKKKMTKKLREVDVRKSCERNRNAKVNKNFRKELAEGERALRFGEKLDAEM